MIYLMNYYMLGITDNETFACLPYLLLPWVLLAAEQALRKRKLRLAALSGLLLNFSLAFFLSSLHLSSS